MITDEDPYVPNWGSGVKYLVDAVGLDSGVDEFRHELSFEILWKGK